MLPPEEELFSLPFEATISAVYLSGDRPAYSWVAQVRNPISGEMEDADPPRWGAEDVNPLFEVNDRDDVPTDTVVLVTFNGYVGGEPTYRFDAGPAPAAGGSLTAKQLNSSLSTTATYAGITEAQFGNYTDDAGTRYAGGIVISNPSAGVVRAWLGAAGATLAGGVTTGPQHFAGLKEFDDGLVSRDVVYMRDAGSAVEFRTADAATESVSYAAASASGAPLAEVIASDDALGYNAMLSVGYNTATASRGSFDFSNTTPAGNDYPTLKLTAAGFGTLTGGDVASGLGQRFQSGLFISGRPAARTPPASSTSTGTFGDLACDNSWLYVCTGTNTWRRVALTTF
jgi:hypothetical protein